MPANKNRFGKELTGKLDVKQSVHDNDHKLPLTKIDHMFYNEQHDQYP